MPRRSPDAAGSTIVEAAHRMVGQIEALIDEMAALRLDNEALREELHEAVAMMERASAVLGGSLGVRHVRPAAGEDRRRTRGRKLKGPKGRATPAAVTSDVVKAVLAKLGEATAAEVAAEITTAGVPVSGRAVRFIAERAGAQTTVGEDGQRRYRLA